MEPERLSPIMKKAYDALSSEEEKKVFLEQFNGLWRQAMNGAACQIISRNLSHHIGKHVLKKCKNT